MLITFEGIDGSGKSTQARMLVERLREDGRSVLLVREPGGTELGEQVRTLLLAPDLDPVPLAELLLFSAARAQLVAERIRPALGEGQVVVCDRFYDSSVAYQGSARGLDDFGWLDAFNEHVTGGLVPDCTFLVDLPVEAARQRRHDRGGGDRLEGAGLDFQMRVQVGYDALAERHADRVRRLDGTRSVEALHAAVWADVAPRLGLEDGTPSPSTGSSG